MKATLLALIAVTGCTATPPADEVRESAQHKRADAQLKAVDHYRQIYQNCRAAGRTIYVRRSSGRFPLTRSELQSAMCGLPPGR
jgi:hypothetical protein